MQFLQFAWAILCPGYTLLAIQAQLELGGFVNLFLCICALVPQPKIIYLAMSSSELKRLLGNDRVTLIVGSVVVIWVSIAQIWQIVQPLLS